jgi:hypothetical protein
MNASSEVVLVEQDVLFRVIDLKPKKKSMPPRDLGVKDSVVTERKEAEAAAREFVLNHLREHGTLPKWELLMKDPKFAQAVESEDERIRAEAAQEILARQLKTKQLIEEIEQEQQQQQKLDERRQKLIEEAKLKGGARAKLLEGTENLKGSQILDKIMGNFSSIGFKYSSNYKSGGVLDGGTSGDCKTLAETFKALAHEIGFPEAEVKGFVGDFMAAGGPIVDPAWGVGNANNDKSWIFQNHYWLVWKGGVYDVLFNRRSVDLGVKRDGEPFDDNDGTGMICESYGGVKYWAGMLNGNYLRYVPISEQEIEKIRLERKQQAAIKDPITPEVVKKVLDRIENGPVPEEFMQRTIEHMVELGITVRGSSSSSSFISKQAAMFCDNSSGGTYDFIFNKEKWEKWLRG